MKKTTSLHQFLKISVLASALWLCSFHGITSIAVTHAIRPTKCSRHVELCTPTPIPTLTAQPPSAPTLIATQPPKGILSPQGQPNATRIVLPGSTGTAEIPPPPTIPTTASASATAIAVPVPAKQTTPWTDATPPNQQSQSTADQGFTILMLSLGAGAPVFLLSGTILWFLWRRQTSQHQSARQGISRNAQASRAMRSRGRLSPLDASSAILASGVSERWPLLGSPEPMPSSRRTNTPNDPHSMTTTCPQHMLPMLSNTAARSLQDGDSPSLLMGTLDLPLQPTEAGESNKNGRMLPLAPAPTALVETSPASMPSSPPVTIQPPSIKDDAMLESVMRQAQMGLFALLGR